MITVIIVLVLLPLLYYFGTRSFTYWEERNVKHDKPMPFLGTNVDNFLMRKSMTEMAAEMYRKYPNEKVVGFYRALRPELVVRDPEIIKRILTTDFSHFHARGLNIHKKVIEPVFRNLFFADGDLWRLLRQRMTPAFTSGKLRAMFPLVAERAEKLQKRALAAAEAGLEQDARDLMARYTTDFIGACGFGLDADSLNDEDSAFRKLGSMIFANSPRIVVVRMLKLLFPELLKNVKIRGDLERDLMSIFVDILKQRNHQVSGRNDFIDLLLECKSKGLMVGDSIENMKPDGKPERVQVELDEKLMAAQALVFFAAGFETSSSATSFTLHQLAHNPEEQRKVQEEIDRVLAAHDNKLSYDAIKEMTYLDCAFKEGMRMFPSLGFLIRECVSKYTIPELNISIDPGVTVLVPLQALHNDPRFFPNPEEFRPERFLPENFDPANKHVYMPFGTGPRACIGERLGQMQSLAGLAAVLSSSWVAPVPKAPYHLSVDPTVSIVQVVKGGLPLLFSKRKAH